MTLDLYLLPIIKNIYVDHPNLEIPWRSHPYQFPLIGVKQYQQSKHFNFGGDGLQASEQMLRNFIGGISMTRKRDKIWTTIIATRQWFTKLFTSEADALVDDFGNNPPPEIGTQSYSGDIHDKGD